MGQTLTPAAVRDVARELVDANGQTTTLDIKVELRNRGFYALQDEVSNLLDLEYQGVGLIWEPGPGYRIYKADNNVPAGTNTAASALLGMSGPGYVPVGLRPPGATYGAHQPTPFKQPSKPPKSVRRLTGIGVSRDPVVKAPGTWEVSRPSSVGGTYRDYFDGRLSEGKAKSAFAAQYGGTFFEIRARRVK